MDYYQILNVSPNASHDEIKSAFRKLALQYHPDKNKSPDASHRFQQIQQAWQVLKDKRSREAYNYRRYRQQPQQTARPLAKDLDELRKEIAALHRKLQSLDPFRVDYDLVLYAVKDVLSEHNLQLFKAQPTTAQHAEIFRNILGSMRSLPYPIARTLVQVLSRLVHTDTQLQHELNTWIRQAQWQYYWNRYKIWFALAVAVLFCWWLLRSS